MRDGPDVARMVLLPGGAVVLISLAVGLLGALGAGRLIHNQLFGGRPPTRFAE